MNMNELGSVLTAARDGPTTFQPQPLRSIRDTGLPDAFLNGLAIRHLYTGIEYSVSQLSSRMALPIVVTRCLLHRLRAAGLSEPVGSPEDGAAQVWSLTALGRLRATESRAASKYLGTAPVPLQTYQRSIAHQSGQWAFNDDGLKNALSDLALEQQTIEQLGAALQSRRHFTVYGPPGSGRSALIDRFGRIDPQPIYVPRSILVGDQVLSVPHPASYQATDPFDDQGGTDTVSARSAQGLYFSADARWLKTGRPVVVAHPEHGMESLRVQTDAVTGALTAPLHVQAATGWLVIDQASGAGRWRQKMLEHLMSVADAGMDRLTLPGGQIIDIPIRCTVVAIDSRPPWKRGHCAARRCGPSIGLAPLGVATYRKALALSARRLAIDCDESAAEFLIEVLHARTSLPRLGSVPSALLRRAVEQARGAEKQARATPAALLAAWASLFGPLRKEE